MLTRPDHSRPRPADQGQVQCQALSRPRLPVWKFATESYTVLEALGVFLP